MLALILEKVVLSAFVSLCMLTFFSFASSFSEQRDQSSFASAELLYCSVPFIVFPFFLSSLHLVNHFFFFLLIVVMRSASLFFFWVEEKTVACTHPHPYTHISALTSSAYLFFFFCVGSPLYESSGVVARFCPTLVKQREERERKKTGGTETAMCVS